MIVRFVKQRIRRFHDDTRGAISVLVILTIWCLVAMIGLLWNSMEESRRRSEIQTAADSAAHAAAMHLEHAGNAITAQNMVICQDASAESIWGAIPPTDTALGNTLDGEIQTANRMKQQQTLQDLQQQIQQQIIQIAADSQLTLDALQNLQTGSGANFSSVNEQILFMNSLRQADSARIWVLNTYVNGATPPRPDPGAPIRPGPPGPNGEGLVQIVAKWQPVASQNQILDYIINFILTQEKPYQTAFEQRTAFARAEPVDSEKAQHEAEVYSNELAMVQSVPAAIELQRQQLAEFYKTDITLATLKNNSGGSAMVTAPYVPASDIPPFSQHTDLIRSRYPGPAAAAGLPITYDMDAINPNYDQTRIWHPGITVAVPGDLRALYPALRPSYTVAANANWGDLVGMPLEHYFNQRVAGDLQDINNDYMIPLDLSRTQTLARAIRDMLGVPNDGNIRIANLPATIPDDRAEPILPAPPLPPGTIPPPPPPPRYDNIYVLPRLTAPANASAAYRTQVDLYNSNGAKVTADTRAHLRDLIIFYAQFFQQFVTGFASASWQGNVHNSAAQVFLTLSEKKQFMVLDTYGLRPIPAWAQGGMYDSAVAQIENQVLSIAMNTVASSIIGDLIRTNSGNVGGGILDGYTLSNVLTGAYAPQAAQVADQIIRPAAHQIAIEIATEWVNRPWPYEITPPDVDVPPVRGILPFERKREFTVLAAARQTEETTPKIFLPAIFGTDSRQLIAYAQAEMFNWNEFNTAAGAQRYDQTTPIPEIVYRVGTNSYSGFIGAPRGWRVATLAGWNWRARLSYSDSLYEQMQVNTELSGYFNDSGIVNPSSGALDAVNLH